MRWILFCGVLVCVARVAEFGALHKSDTNTKTDITTTHEELESLPKHECRPGTEWTSQCNECHCTKRGRKRCTENICDKQQQEEERHCAALTSWRNDCNSCFCTENGQPSCTEKACKELALEPAPAASDALPRGKDCAAGTKWKSQCNECACTENGVTICTEKACIGYETDRVLTCAPESSWINDCNTCWCMDGRALCTKIGCHAPIHDLSFNDDEKKPLNNKEKEPESNASVTRKTRAAPAQAKETPKACTPGQEFRMDCNTCLCDNEGQDFSCTRIDCNNNHNSPSRRRRDVTNQDIDQCTPGSVFERECNVCRCDDDGHHAKCTTHRCEKPSEANQEDNNADTNFRCNAGEKFKRDCNDCTCSADGKSVFCTVNFCDKDIDNIKV